jgi:hypothetical protein
MNERTKKRGPEDVNEIAFRVASQTTGAKTPPKIARAKKGGVARAKSLTPEKRSEIAQKGAKKRWAKMSLSFVIVPEGDGWTAHGLEHNISTCSKSLHRLRDKIGLVVQGYVELGGLDAIRAVPRANDELWKMYFEAKSAGRLLDDYLDANPQGQVNYALELQAA